MSALPRNVVVTGLGATTSLGGTAPETWEGMLAGRSGVTSLGEEYVDHPSRIAAQAAVDPSEVMDRVQMRKLDRSEQFALIAAREAIADAGGVDEVDPDRLGAVVASGIGGISSLLAGYDVLNSRGPSRVSPHFVTMIMPNGPAAWVGLEIGAQAGIHTPVSACGSGAEAIVYAARMIQEGRADVVVAGGTEAAIHPLSMAAFGTMRALSTRNDDPQGASRPFDVGRNGFVMGEGAGIVVLESEEHARARGAKIYAYFAGAGMTSDGHHIAQPEPEGRGNARAMELALEDSGLSATDIVHVNAHATSTPLGDVAEIKGIHAALGAAADRLVISATKSMTGHLLGGAGAVESVAAIKALQDRKAPPTINLHEKDPAVDLDVATEVRDLPEGDIAALNNSFGFGGHNIALIFRNA